MTSRNTAGAAQRPIYDPQAALEFFKSAGKPASIARGRTIFGENESAKPLLFKRNKMYLLLDGEVNLLAGRKPLGTVGKGEIFGEMAAIARVPRSASAVANTACRVIALDDQQFLKALSRKPGFALMLMSMMIGRLRETVARLGAANAIAEDAALKAATVFDPKRLARLASGLSSDEPAHYDRKRPIVQEGQAGLRMYVVLEGNVTVSIRGKLIERLGPGGVFGELALVDQSPRLASVVAETDCSVLPINRNAFLALVKTSPDFAASLLGSLAQRLRSLTRKLK